VLCVKVYQVYSTRLLAEALIAVDKKMYVFNWLLTFRERVNARERASPRLIALIRRRRNANYVP